MEHVLGFGQLGTLLQHYGALGLLFLAIAWGAIQSILANRGLRDQDGRHREHLDRVINELRSVEERHRKETLEIVRKHQAEFSRVLAEHREYMHRLGSMYGNNVRLVKNYGEAMDRMDRLVKEVLGVVSLNTQT
ncbi:MAG: hypothetical protein ABIJ95_11600, partial [Pseudomonadota bacterium]